MFKQRLISSLIFVPISLAAFYFGNWALLLFMGLVLGGLGAYEYSRILNQAGLRVNQVLVVGGVLALVALRHFFWFSIWGGVECKRFVTRACRARAFSV